MEMKNSFIFTRNEKKELNIKFGYILLSDSKIVDTRTFTRPKKRLFTFPEGNNTMTFAEHRERASSDELVSLINFLVTQFTLNVCVAE